MTKRFSVSTFDPMKAVYTYLFPETRRVLDYAQRFMHDELFRVTCSVERAQQLLAGLSPTKPLTIPATKDGRIDLDEIHVPIIDRVVDAYDTTLKGVRGFKWRYPGAGSSTCLFHLLVQLLVRGVKNINVIEGEYEGYGAQAEKLGIATTTHSQTAVRDPGKIAPGYWFISNPSACFGNILGNDFIRSLCDADHKVVLDLSYVGSTAPYEFDLSHENIVAALLSFSKPYGVFRRRLGGFAFCREEVPTLYGSKWFKDVQRLIEALAIVEQIGPAKLYPRYSGVQLTIIDALNARFGLGLQDSDVLLLAHLPVSRTAGFSADKLEMIAQFRRGGHYRFCLTPYFEQYETLNA